MRAFSEPTARNLLRKPLVMGVPVQGLVLLAFVSMAISVAAGKSLAGNVLALAIGILGYCLLRIFSRFAKSGWEESIIFYLQLFFQRKGEECGTINRVESSIEISAPDTLEDTDFILSKELVSERLRGLRAKERLFFMASFSQAGAKIEEFETKGRRRIERGQDVAVATAGLFVTKDYLYSLHQLPVTTDPLWLFSVLSKLSGSFRVFISVTGVDFSQIKRRVELSRRGNAHSGAGLSNVDSDISFEEASHVLRGLSRGDETIVELSLVIASEREQLLDPAFFTKETNPLLVATSILGLRGRYHRSHFVRTVTAADLIPNIADPIDIGSPILNTVRQVPLYFSPHDSRLEALHWLVVGASGSGKSFFTGLVLKRMADASEKMAVLFVDHNRSFRRFVRSSDGSYLEPGALDSAKREILGLLQGLNKVGYICGIELSDLPIDEKKSATHYILSEIERFLRNRNTTHPVYVVLDECWNFMRDEPVLVQRAFREFRKLNGAAIAITQSLSDFLSDQSGQSIFQNAPIRILLRQGEDLSRYQGVLGLNEVELSKLRLLRQKRGEFSECLIKTPFLSRIGRLYPTEAEHELLRTDNLRAEVIAESRLVGGVACEASA